eukprot:XP_022277438.1 3-ketoacyl-CoA thiolase, mitochondrial [Canis lupus familiaris]
MGVFIVAAKRTPFGAYGGLLKDFTATDLTELAARAALSAGGVSPEAIDSIIVGNVMQSSSDAPYLARHVGLRVGVPKEVPAFVVNRLCGSGFQSIVSGCQQSLQTLGSEGFPAQTTLEQLNKLPPLFKKEGTVTAGNASGVSDGAGAVIIASEDAVKKHNFTPLARIVGYFVSGCDPSIMGIGPVPAINGALKKIGRSLKDMDLVEVNEAFAPQYLAVEKSLDLDPSKTNVNGGAIALGHPLGGSGTRIMAHLVHELRRRGGKYAMGSACIGGGQGIAVVIESTA